MPRTALRANFMAMLEEQKAQLQPAAPAPAAPAQPEAKVVSMWPTAIANNWMRVAASIVLIAAGVFLGRQLPWGSRSTDGVATTTSATDKNTHYALGNALADKNNNVSASDRIQLVTNSSKESEPGDPTVQVLLNTLNFDPNPNVRLAACEALYRLRDDPRVREGLANSLAIQTDPNVQIALIDMVVSMRVRRAVPQARAPLQAP
ncbi:HEAT repeat domain-containing protein [Hymenobacter humi]|uniref:HEAT repeat domain-containing protein n=1 Tax=Hymenobacter humi TaxID=1411620 RepID=A0ABW2UBR7_9BACT